jgi:murein DD-endopeptidase MepM/ murein hydrolase activator NlpD
VQRINQLPDLKTQLIDVYKRGRSGYARMLFSAGDLREFARATRAVGALSAINDRRIEEHRKTLEAMRAERAAFEQKAKELQAKTAEARRAKSAADGAVASASELIRQIDSRRDLTAQYVGELQDAYNKVQQQIAALATRSLRPEKPWPFRCARSRGPSIGPFKGASWGSSGRRRIASAEVPRETASRSRGGGHAGARHPWRHCRLCRPVHRVRHAGHPRPWEQRLFALRLLGSTGLQQGKPLKPVQRWAGVGLAPAGPPTLYFEMRIDGRSVNPVQWLKPR